MYVHTHIRVLRAVPFCLLLCPQCLLQSQRKVRDKIVNICWKCNLLINKTQIFPLFFPIHKWKHLTCHSCKFIGRIELINCVKETWKHVSIYKSKAALLLQFKFIKSPTFLTVGHKLKKSKIYRNDNFKDNYFNFLNDLARKKLLGLNGEVFIFNGSSIKEKNSLLHTNLTA